MPIVVRLLLVIPALLTAGILAIAAHEAGHVLGARLGNFSVRMFTAGPFKLVRGADGRWRVRWVSTAGEAGGLVIATPTRTEGLRRSAMLLAGGGPAVSLIAGAGALLLYRLAGFDEFTWSANGAWMAVSAAVFTFWLLSIGLAVVTGVPYLVAGISSDGRRVLLLARGGAGAERHAAVMAMSGWFATNSVLDDATVERALAPGDDGSFDAVMARYLAYLNSLHVADPVRAGAHIDVLAGAIDTVPPSLRPVVRAESAYFAAAYRGDASAARVLLDHATQSPMLDAHTRRRVEIAVLRAGGDTEAGNARLRDFLAELEGSQTTFGSAFLIGELRRLAQTSRPMVPQGRLAHSRQE